RDEQNLARVLVEARWRVERRQAIRVRVRLKAARRTIPSRQHRSTRNQAGDPDVAARVFEDAVGGVLSKAVTNRVGRRSPGCEILDTANAGKPHHSNRGCEPPVAEMILNHPPVRGPAGREYPCRHVHANGVEALAVETTDAPVLAERDEVAGSVL